MKQLPFSKQQVELIDKEYPTPFYLYDKAGITKTVNELNAAFAWNKGFCEYFAVKALPNPYILRLLGELGCGTDCATLPELLLSKAAGIVGEKIMFSSNDTPDEDFQLAAKLGAIINLDDISHVEAVEKSCGIPKTVCCRYNPGTFDIGTNSIMGDLSDTKYGMTKSQLIEAMCLLRDKGAEKFGIHSMLISCSLDENYFPTLAEMLFDLAAELKREHGIEISFIDLAGGIGIPYLPEEKPVDIAAIGAGVKEAYDRIAVPAGLEISLCAELGRYITGPHGYLVSKVLHHKNTYKKYVGLDASAANLMRPAMYGAYHHITALGKENAAATEVYDITGGLCENNDKFAVDRKMPVLEKGDFVAIHDAVAHGYSMGYNYNGKLRCAELMLLEDGTVQRIRRAETVNDYFATFDFTDELDFKA